MFNSPPRVLSHVASIDTGNFVTPEYILNKNSNEEVNLFNRYCPHRMYPLHSPGEIIKEITCNFHNFKWAENGTPLNNSKKINCGKASIGKSGLIFKNFKEPDHKWVNDLSQEQQLKYSHSYQGSSNGSWLWMMEVQADLLHIRKGKNAVHPVLSEQIDLDSVSLDQGEDWILQSFSTGWWLFIYPFTFVEWSPGCLCINYSIPNDINNEFKFDWFTQFYYDSSVSDSKRKDFDTIEDVYKEDLQAIEKQKGSYFPLMSANDRLEEQCVHWGQWFNKNKVRT
jgi:nitrite reductase/ring-hydroxylating ferredoxin subunit